MNSLPTSWPEAIIARNSDRLVVGWLVLTRRTLLKPRHGRVAPLTKIPPQFPLCIEHVIPLGLAKKVKEFTVEIGAPKAVFEPGIPVDRCKVGRILDHEQAVYRTRRYRRFGCEGRHDNWVLGHPTRLVSTLYVWNQTHDSVLWDEVDTAALQPAKSAGHSWQCSRCRIPWV